jgi:hypothetical protein
VKRLENYKTVFVDIDETLLMSDLSEFPEESQIEIKYGPGSIAVVPNSKNVKLVQKFFKLNYAVVLWSRTGSDWAEAAGKALGIDSMVSLYLTKPQFYIDDKPCESWMGQRCWRDPKNGKEE